MHNYFLSYFLDATLEEPLVNVKVEDPNTIHENGDDGQNVDMNSLSTKSREAIDSKKVPG